MAYSDEGVRAKLSALNETQESIVTVAQWIMFHRRYADRSASVWLQKVKDSGASKRLNLIYLANEVVQQSKARKKDDFLIAFSPIIAEATATAYKGAISEVQSKIRRVIEVWRQRQIFELPIQEAIEARIGEIDKSRSSGKKPLLGANPFSSSSSSGPSAPPEIQPLIPLQIAISKAALAMTTNVSNNNALAEYEKQMGPDATTIISAPVHAARLSALLKTLASAEGAVSESIKARRDLISGLEKLLDTNRTALQGEEKEFEEVAAKKSAVETRKREVEDEILRNLPSEGSVGLNAGEGGTSLVGGDGAGDQMNGNGAGDQEEDNARPQMEELTPPPTESLTPVGSPGAAPPTTTAGLAFPSHGAADLDTVMATTATTVTTRAFPGSPFSDAAGAAANKKRKLESGFGTEGPYPQHQEFLPGDAMADLDEDVAALLRAESGGGN